jgi:hypothetical protein
MTPIADDHPMQAHAHHFGREVATTLLVNTGVLAFVNATQAYDAAMKFLHFIVLLGSAIYTGFKAASAYSEWANKRARRKAREANQK